MINYVFLSNNVRGIEASEKRLKLFEHCRNLDTSARFVFLRETHSSVDVKKKWKNDFQGQLFFWHDKTNSCGVAIGSYGKKPFELLNKFYDKSERVLIIEVKMKNEVLLLINLYYAKMENGELSTLSDHSNMLEKTNDVNNKNIVFWGDFNLLFEAKLEAQAGNPVLFSKTNTNKRKILLVWYMEN